jgi:tRNA-specific 2-thiouridylase
MAENELVVVQGHDHPLLLRSSLQGLDASWVLDAPAAGTAHSAKTRYRQADSACTVARVEPGGIAVDFSQPHWAVTPGQSVVLYDGEVCLGGAVIA